MKNYSTKLKESNQNKDSSLQGGDNIGNFKSPSPPSSPPKNEFVKI